VSQVQGTARVGLLARLLADRGLWKQAIFLTAFLTYLCSFLFFGLAAAEAADNGPTPRALLDLLAATYFLLQVIFLFVLAWFVERRRQHQAIDFPDRRRDE